MLLLSLSIAFNIPILRTNPFDSLVFIVIPDVILYFSFQLPLDDENYVECLIHRRTNQTMYPVTIAGWVVSRTWAGKECVHSDKATTD